MFSDEDLFELADEMIRELDMSHDDEEFFEALCQLTPPRRFTADDEFEDLE